MYIWHMHEIRDMVFLETGLGTNLEDVKMSHVDMDVSKNSGFPPNHPVLIGFSITNHPFGVPLFLETPI